MAWLLNLFAVSLEYRFLESVVCQLSRAVAADRGVGSGEQFLFGTFYKGLATHILNFAFLIQRMESKLCRCISPSRAICKYISIKIILVVAKQGGPSSCKPRYKISNTGIICMLSLLTIMTWREHKYWIDLCRCWYIADHDTNVDLVTVLGKHQPTLRQIIAKIESQIVVPGAFRGFFFTSW